MRVWCARAVESKILKRQLTATFTKYIHCISDIWDIFIGAFRFLGLVQFVDGQVLAAVGSLQVERECARACARAWEREKERKECVRVYFWG